MSTNPPVVVGTDGSEHSTAAVLWAADDAMRRRAPLRIVHVMEPWEGPVDVPADVRAGQDRTATELLEQAAADARSAQPSLQVLTTRSTGNIAGTLIAESAEADRLVLGSRGRGGFTGLLLGSTTQRVSGRLRIPLVVVRERPARTHGRIVVGVDDSPSNDAAVEFAFAEAAQRSAHLTAVFAWQLPVMTGFEPDYGLWAEDTIAAYEQMVADVLGPRRERYREVEVSTEVVQATNPAAALSEAATEADLLVVGTRGRGMVASLALGSVSQGVLQQSPCPVAVVNGASEED